MNSNPVNVFITDSDYSCDDRSFSYLLGFQPSLGGMLLTKDKLDIILDPRYFGRKNSINKENIRKKIGNENLKINFTEARVTAEEIQNTIKAIEIIDDVFLGILELVETEKIIGMTEMQIRGFIINKIFEFGGSGPLLIDMGAIYKGYCSDFTRTIRIGDKNNAHYDRFTNIYDIVKEAHDIAFDGAKVGMTGKKIDALARDYIEKQGLGKYFTHGLGHGVGINIHESPRIKYDSSNEIKNGMIFTVEPGIYRKGEFGIRLEDIGIMINGKLENFSKIPL